MNFKVYIPARFASTRLPGKPLLQAAGKPLLWYVLARARESGAAEVVIATDDERIAQTARRFGAAVCMTANSHESGTDRLAEATRLMHEREDEVIVNLQGDEPEMPAAVIRQTAALLHARAAPDIATVCEPFTAEADWRNPNQVKVVRDEQDRALYFSRAPVPHLRDAAAWQPAREFRRHIGIYAYRTAYLHEFVRLAPSALERYERLEQLRALSAGAVIKVPDAAANCGVGIDTPDDFARFCAQLSAQELA